MFELVDSAPQNAVIKVIGVGGGGGNAVQHMLGRHIDGVDFIAANTDAQALRHLDAKTTLQLGASVTKGLGAGADPEMGRQAALEDRDRIADILRGTDMLFVTAGMGGGTGTGAAPVIAEVARELAVLTVAVVTRPFTFENRMEVANSGIDQLAEFVDSLIVVPNEKLLAVLGAETTMLEAFSAANDVLLGAVQGISDLIVKPGLINVDFADVRTVMAEMGMAMMGTGRASGPSRARDAAEAAIHSPLLEDVHIDGARGVLVNVTAGTDVGLGEFAEVGDAIKTFASNRGRVVIGTVIDPSAGEELKVTVVATGLGDPTESAAPSPTVSRAGAEGVNYDEFDLPPAIREHPGTQRRKEAPPAAEPAVEYLDIPAFIRRQAM